jgi:hypothetical protein
MYVSTHYFLAIDMHQQHYKNATFIFHHSIPLESCFAMRLDATSDGTVDASEAGEEVRE